MADLEALEKSALAALHTCNSEDELKSWHTQFFGKQGEMTQAIRGIGSVAPEERKTYGQTANRVKETLTNAYEQAIEEQKKKALEASLKTDALDVTLPGRSQSRGRLHVSTQTLRQIYSIFSDMGFQVYRSREVEDDETNFEMLNMPPHHPARDMWDTFYTTKKGVILRTHTSPGQIHVMR